jgi:hypothetical protein
VWCVCGVCVVCVCGVYESVCVCERDRERWPMFQMFAALRVILSINLNNPDTIPVTTFSYA